MKKSLLTFAGACLVLGATNVSAISYQISQDIGVTLGTFGGNTVSSYDSGLNSTSFNLLALNYNPASEILTAATLTFNFAAAVIGTDPVPFPTATVTVDLGGLALLDPATISDPFTVFPLIGILGTGINANAFFSLSSTGTLSYLVTWDPNSTGNMDFISAQLDADSSPIGGTPGAVPDAGSSLGLMGLAFAGLVSMRKRLTK